MYIPIYIVTCSHYIPIISLWIGKKTRKQAKSVCLRSPAYANTKEKLRVGCLQSRQLLNYNGTPQVRPWLLVK